MRLNFYFRKNRNLWNIQGVHITSNELAKPEDILQVSICESLT